MFLSPALLLAPLCSCYSLLFHVLLELFAYTFRLGDECLAAWVVASVLALLCFKRFELTKQRVLVAPASLACFLCKSVQEGGYTHRVLLLHLLRFEVAVRQNPVHLCVHELVLLVREAIHCVLEAVWWPLRVTHADCYLDCFMIRWLAQHLTCTRHLQLALVYVCGANESWQSTDHTWVDEDAIDCAHRPTGAHRWFAWVRHCVSILEPPCLLRTESHADVCVGL